MTDRDWTSRLAFDRDHLWHPYTSMHAPLPVFPVESAAGVRIKLADGRELIDGMASWWSVIHGYNHPRLNAALQRQLERTAHVMFGGLTHAPAIELGQRLVRMTPATLTKVFFCDSGSIAVEVAIKMALQYQQAAGRTKRTRLLTVRGGYHGDTLGAMSVCDPVTGMHSLFAGVLAQQLFAPRPGPAFHEPWEDRFGSELERLFDAHADELAAIVLEPIVQGAGGMWFYQPEYLRRVRQLCDAHDVLLICDEIATGFGRSGRLFGCEHAGITPDIMCLGKALTGGYLTLAATLATDEVAEMISRGPAGGAFMHGPTFMANPLACSVACESLDLLEANDWRAQVGRIEARLRQGLEGCRAEASVADVRVLGAIGVVELERPVDVAQFQRFCVERGVWIRPFGKLVYVMPPYVIDDADLDRVMDVMTAFAKRV
jgi:adenosylmethionine-8-amino-7-oxononanoate aminotransferase